MSVTVKRKPGTSKLDTEDMFIDDVADRRFMNKFVNQLAADVAAAITRDGLDVWLDGAYTGLKRAHDPDRIVMRLGYGPFETGPQWEVSLRRLIGSCLDTWATMSDTRPEGKIGPDYLPRMAALRDHLAGLVDMLDRKMRAVK